MKKILILGTSGMAGHLIYLYLKEKGYNVFSISRKKLDYVTDNYYILDLLDFNTLNDIIVREEFDFIINCVGILNQNCDINLSNSILINSYLPHLLVELTKNLKTKIIHISTDCVFKGDKGPYFEDSIPDGLTIYDKTKSLGEINDSKNITLRQSIIGPDINQKGIGLYNWFMKQDNAISGYDGVVWTGITTLMLAKIIEIIIINDSYRGLFNVVNNRTITKYEMLCLFNQKRVNKINISKVENPVIRKILISTRNDFLEFIPTYEEMINEMNDWIKKHIYLYPHYKMKLEA